jgi:type I restriction enzyme S subunit
MAKARTPVMEPAVTSDFALDQVPPDWEVVDFEESVFRGRVKVSKVKSSDYLPEGKHPVIDQGQEFIAGYSNQDKGIYAGDLPVIVFGDHTRIFKFVDFPFFAGADGTQILVPQTGKFDPRFLYFALTHIKVPSRGYNRHFSILKQKKIVCPPLSEQRAIAHVLRTVQRAKEATEKVIAAAHQLKQSLMRHLFTYGPVPVDQADHVELRETEFGDVPADWKIETLSHCAEVQTGIAKGRKVEAADAIMVPYLRVANVQDGFLDLTEIKEIPIRKGELKRFALKAGDVLLTEGGDFDKLGRGFIWNGEIPTCVHQNHIFAVRANRQTISSDYLAYLTQSQYGKSYFLTVAHRTTHLACINTTKLKALPVPIPPLQGQEAITGRLKTIDRKYLTEMDRRNALDTLFQTLLHGLMTGQIRLPGFASAKVR